jgi:hypothetical protein
VEHKEIPKCAKILFRTLDLTTHKFMFIKNSKLNSSCLENELGIIFNVDLEKQGVLNFNCDLN